jgi:hypothetical protein
METQEKGCGEEMNHSDFFKKRENKRPFSSRNQSKNRQKRYISTTTDQTGISYGKSSFYPL